MIYNSFNFIVVFPLIFLLYYVIPAKYNKLRNVFLLFVSYLLYVQWKPVYGLILLGVTFITFYGAKYIERVMYPKLLLIFSVLLSLSPLLFFKYFNFVNGIVDSLLMVIGLKFDMPGLNWAIPIGISFFTFQGLSYIWDVYYGKQKAETDLLGYTLYLSFFPYILSGPINKASLIMPQIKSERPSFDYDKVVTGLKMLLWGMFMKVVVADRVALYVDTVFPNYINYTGVTCLFASVLYSVQIYADFAGYSLMAIGVGKILGFDLTENFRRPYFAETVTEFWHRWHISLSTWLKDYVYIPLGGSRCSRMKNYWNIFITFIISGIWHGANWTFILWGGVHGVFQIIEKMLGLQKKKLKLFGRIIRIIITFVCVNFAWVFFRMPTVDDAINVIARMFDFTLPMSLYFPLDTMSLSFIGIALLFLKDLRDEFFPDRMALMNSKYTIVRWFTYISLMVSIMLMGVFSSDQFIYANF